MGEEQINGIREGEDMPKPKMPLYVRLVQFWSNVAFALGVASFLLAFLASLALGARPILFGGFRVYHSPASDVFDYLAWLSGGTGLATIYAAASLALPTLICAVVVRAFTKDEEIGRICVTAIRNSFGAILPYVLVATIAPRVTNW